MTATDISEVADRLFRAIEAGDIATVSELFSDDIAVWRTGDRDRNKQRALRVIDWFIGATTARRYEVLDRRIFDGGFVQQHILHARGHGGGSIAMRVCLVIDVDEAGRITRIAEYLDPADLTPLLDSNP
ncbi:snoaL-like domain protein [Mycolicibacterium hassiacum DSM 44199]|uniref:SnoaL-like domain protein n=1 Tax=Mycolicibacterium hassiacum (strain DSM 44199 / CIP 105218 / JCM 12690 / 3849) TaxID=1122247 RepID=K5BG58_MYCHD|nr:nuclear transport factor 2 family protein [Mycolicibacterium hassiacum]EKF24497.1 snoaL-like domain protein [Mycolicibacterium hassiacum DSM 44199]MDA4084380.1 ketosteroid isomerase [Mycolicibacterium hassiacum DSM 44199]VCT88939.1 hypothetical protein MHAS_00624 [Mycolicibacterium hassiacum DSM 44199]